MDPDSLINGIAHNLDADPQPIHTLARQSHHSRSQFFRLFRALIAEPPAAMRRRLQLERAAWRLTRTQLPVTDIALDAGYNSLEAFTRAFGKSFRV